MAYINGGKMIIKKIYFLLIFILINLISYGKIYYAETNNFYPNDSLIIGKTSRIKFSTTVSIKKDETTLNDYCYFYNYSDGDFIKITNIIIKNNTYKKIGNNKIFFVDKNNRQHEKVDVELDGEIILNWNKYNNVGDIKNRFENIKIGYINDEQNPIVMNLNMSDLNPINNIKIDVLNDMDLGTVFSGEKMSTKKTDNNAYPAKIKIEGENNKKIKLTIPKQINIVNKNNDVLVVDLTFRNNNSNILSINLNEGNGSIKYNSIILSDEILIDGESQTKNNSSGLYEGTFIVRVEYLFD